MPTVLSRGAAVLLVVILSAGLGAQPPGLDRCGSMPYLQSLTQAHPWMLAQMAAIEAHTQQYIASNPPVAGPDVVFTIPVVVHVVYNTAAQNLSDQQIQTQITVLNEDFRRLNADAGSTPAIFLPVAADCEFQFCLAARNPQGQATTGITRISTSVTSFSFSNDAIKFTAQGGRDAWPRDQYLNLWVGPLQGGLLGYATFPGGPAAVDGVVCASEYFGRLGSALAPFNLGRTTTHEVGHWLNMRHIWGDNQPNCGDDLVADTPAADNSHFGCQTGIVSCGVQNMVQNYMDYSDDGCMNLFTQGQKSRMRALFATGGFRASLLQSPGCTPVTGACPAETGEPNNTCATATVLSVGTTVNRNLCPANDMDFHSFTLGSPQQVTVTMVPPQSPCLDYDLQLFSACGTFLGFSATAGCATETLNAGTLAAGTYRVVVMSPAGASSASATYSLNVSTTGAASCPPEPGEPNDTCATATALTQGQAINRLLCPANDMDFYSFTLATTQQVTVTMIPPQTPCLDYDVQLFSVCGTVLGFSANSGCGTETLNAGTLGAGTYRVVVMSASGANSPAATYSINVTTAAVSGCPTETGEPNNTCATASPLTPGTAITRFICPANDQDWFTFTLPSALPVTVNLVPPQSPCLDYDLALFSACGTQIGSSTNGGCATEVINAGTLAPGTYRVRVDGFQGATSSTATYALAVDFPGAGCPSEAGEPNDTCPIASAITPGQAVSRVICPAGDQDWFTFTLTTLRQVTVNLVPPQIQCLNYDVQLFSACGTFLGASANPGCASETLNAGTLPAGAYRVVVLGASGAFSSTSNYSLTVNSAAVVTCPSETGEPNETCAAATSITPGTAINRFLCPASDVDFYTFTLASSQQVTVTMVPPQNPCLDYDVQLFSACGTILGFSANSGCATETVSAGTLAAGSYRVAVLGSGGANSSTASYAINVTLTAVTGCPSETGEPNNSCPAASALTPGATVNRFICPANDLDWHTFTLTSAQPVTVTLVPPQGPCLDYDVGLFSSCGTLIGVSTNGGCANDIINAGTLPAGTYRVLVEGFNGATSATAAYALTVSGSMAPGCPAEAGEPNETCSAATALVLGTPVSRFLCPAGDFDWYSFTLGSAQPVTLTLVPPQSPCLDYDLQLFSSCGSFVGFSANSGCATETLNAGTLAAGTYRAVVIGAGGASSPTAAYSLTAATSTGSGCTTESGEPNNTCATASALVTGTTVSRLLCPANDLDWHAFTLASTQQVTISMVPPANPCLDYDLQLFSSCGTFLGFSANSGCATETVSAASLAAGTYRVVVIGAGGASSSTATYALIVTTTTGTTCPSENGEPNGTCATATALTPGTPVSRFICPANDLDWYSFTLGSAQAVTISMVPPSSPCLDYDLQLFSSCGTFLGFSANSGCATETISAGSLAAGTYRVVVIGAGGANSGTAAYALTVTASTGGSCPAETGEPNETCAAATALTLGTTVNRFLCPVNDLDWYSFTLSSPQTVIVTMTPPQSPCLDYDVQLFSSCGAFLGFSAVFGCGAETMGPWSLAAGTYRVVVTGFNGAFSSTAPYALTVSTGAVTCFTDPGEPNDTCAAATPISPWSSLARLLCAADVDWYTFTNASSQNVTVTLEPPFTGSCLNYEVQLFSACGTFLNFSAATSCTTELLLAGSLPAGTYRLAVLGSTAAAFSPTAPYLLEVTTGPCAVEPGEPNETCAAATLINHPGTYTRYICSAADVDWYQVTIPSGTATLSLLVPSNPCLTYTLQVVSACATPVSNAPVPCGYGGGPLPAGTYRISVSGSAGAFSATAPYVLTLSN